MRRYVLLPAQIWRMNRAIEELECVRRAVCRANTAAFPVENERALHPVRGCDNGCLGGGGVGAGQTKS